MILTLDVTLTNLKTREEITSTDVYDDIAAILTELQVDKVDMVCYKHGDMEIHNLKVQDLKRLFPDVESIPKGDYVVSIKFTTQDEYVICSECLESVEKGDLDDNTPEILLVERKEI